MNVAATSMGALNVAAAATPGDGASSFEASLIEASAAMREQHGERSEGDGDNMLAGSFTSFPSVDLTEIAASGGVDPVADAAMDGIAMDGIVMDGVGMDGVGMDGVGMDGVGMDGVDVGRAAVAVPLQSEQGDGPAASRAGFGVHGTTHVVPDDGFAGVPASQTAETVTGLTAGTGQMAPAFEFDSAVPGIGQDVTMPDVEEGVAMRQGTAEVHARTETLHGAQPQQVATHGVGPLTDGDNDALVDPTSPVSTAHVMPADNAPADTSTSTTVAGSDGRSDMMAVDAIGDVAGSDVSPSDDAATKPDVDAVQLSGRSAEHVPATRPATVKQIHETQLPATVKEAFETAERSGQPTRLSLSLRPEGLGSVQIEVASHRGMVEIAASATTEAGRAAVERLLPEIRAMVAPAGVKVTELHFGDASAAMTSGGNRSNDGRPDRDDDATPTQAAVSRRTHLTSTFRPSTTHSGAVDLHV